MTDLVGNPFQGYRILGVVGSEGGSNVFKAATLQGDEILAIKFYSQQIGPNQQLINRLRTTYQSVIRLTHPSILPIKSFNVHEGYPYVVMPFMGAGSLEDRIEFGALTAINPLSILREVASALEVVHAHGLVHGDLKPSNILFDEDGNVLLSGIGESPLASSRANLARDAHEHRISYQAPEVIEGRRITPASDQYSLGLIALELLTRLPVDEAFVALEQVQRNGRGTVTRPSPYALDLDARMIAFLLKSLSYDPEERFPSMMEWNSAFFTAFSTEQPSQTSHMRPETVPEENPRRNRLVIFASIPVMILCIALAMPVFGSLQKETITDFIMSLNIFKEEQSSAMPLSGERISGGIVLGSPTPVEKGEDLIGPLAKATETQETEDTPEAEVAKPTAPPTNTPIPPTSTKKPKQLTPTKTPLDQVTATYTITPSPEVTITENVSKTPTEGATSTPEFTPMPTEIIPSDTPPSPDPTIPPWRCGRRRRDGTIVQCTPTPES